MDSSNNRDQYLYFNFRDQFLRIDVSKIVFFESDGNYTYVNTRDNVKTILGINLLRVENILKRRSLAGLKDFVRIGKRYIINIEYVNKINILGQKLVLSDNSTFAHELSISKEALKSLRDIFVGNIVSDSNN